MNLLNVYRTKHKTQEYVHFAILQRQGDGNLGTMTFLRSKKASLIAVLLNL